MANKIRAVLEKHKDHIPVVAMAELLDVMDEAETNRGMKQIFDWMREQMRNMTYEADDWNGETYKAVDLDDAEEIINEAEAKWEADCCEYEYHVAPSKDIYFLTSCKNRHNGMLIANRPYCPYCGKRIKIVEVE